MIDGRKHVHLAVDHDQPVHLVRDPDGFDVSRATPDTRMAARVGQAGVVPPLLGLLLGEAGLGRVEGHFGFRKKGRSYDLPRVGGQQTGFYGRTTNINSEKIHRV